MLKSLKIVVRSYQRKDGSGTFTTMKCGGKFVPLITADEEETYNVKFTKKSKAAAPTKEGIYEVAYIEGQLWIDARPEVADKNFLRLTAEKVAFVKPLPVVEKDIRVK